MQNGSNKLRATVRKLGKSNGPQTNSGEKQGEQKAGGSDQAQSGGSDRSTMRLQEASAEVLTALRQAKEELATEMEANLKQLKSVLEETQRIQKQMEAVLKEARSAPSLEAKAKGQKGQEAGQQAAQDGQKQQNQEEEWNPPVQASGQPGQQGDQAAQQAGGDQTGEEQPLPWEQLPASGGVPYPWEPPQIAPDPVPGGGPPAWQPPTETNDNQSQPRQ